MPLMHGRKGGICVAAFLVLLHPSVAKTSPAQAAASFETDGSVVDQRRGVLDNGLSYVVVQTNSTDRGVELRLQVDAGTLDEKEGEVGVAHLIEHVVVRSSGGAAADKLGALGLTLQGGVAATTGGDYTAYSISLPADRANVWMEALDVVANWAAASALRAGDIDRERAAVLAEASMGASNAEVQAYSRLSATVFAGPCFNQANLDRHDDNIRTASTRTINRFHHDWYTPERQTVVIVGPIDPRRAEAEIRARFARIPARHTHQPDRGRCEAPLRSHDPLVIAVPGLSSITTRLQLNRRLPPLQAGAAAGRTQALDAILSSAFEARTRSAVRRYSSPFTGFVIQQDASGRGAPGRIGNLEFAAWVRRPQDLSEAFNEMERQIGMLRATGLTQDEFDAARTRLLASVNLMRLQTNAAIADRMRNAVREPETSVSPSSLRAALNELTLADANAALAERLTDGSFVNLSISSAPGLVEQLPSPDALVEITQRLASARQAGVPALTPEVDSLLNEADVGEIDRAQQDPAGELHLSHLVSGAVSTRLPNGVRLVFRQDDSEIIRLTLTVMPTNPGEGVGETALGQGLGGVMFNGGAGAFDKFQVEDYLRARGVSYALNVGVDRTVVEASAPAAQLETLLQIVWLGLARPRLDAAAFEDWRNTDRQERALTEASGKAQIDAIEGAFWRSLGAKVAPIAGARDIDLGALRNAFQAKPWMSGQTTVIVTGDLNANQALPLIARYLQALPAKDAVIHPPVPSSASGLLVAEGKVSETIVAGSGPDADVAIHVSGVMPDRLEERVKLELLSSVLNDRVFRRIREQELGAYAPTATVHAVGSNRPGDLYNFVVRFTCKPASVRQLQVAAVEEIERLARTGPDHIELDAARRTALGQTISFSLPPSWHDALVDDPDSSAFAEDNDRRRAMIDTLTRDDIAEAAQQYLNTGHRLELVRLPAP